MNDHTISLADVYQGWDVFQRDLLKAVTPLSLNQWALPVAPTHWPIDRLVQHIAADRAWWFSLWMGEGGADVTPIAHWDEEGQPVRSAAELVAAPRGHMGHDREDARPLDHWRSWANLLSSTQLDRSRAQRFRPEHAPRDHLSCAPARYPSRRRACRRHGRVPAADHLGVIET